MEKNLYLFCHDFRKINGPIKIIEKCTALYPTAAPWGTALGVAPTVGCTGRWGQVPTAVGHGGRIPSVVARAGYRAGLDSLWLGSF
jgi:hypothetical protein